MSNVESSAEGTGWVTYSGIMLIILGVIGIFNGLWAFQASDGAYDAIFWDDNLTAWGWVWLIVGVIVLIAGFGVFNKAQWARWTGIVVAGITILNNLSWAQFQPQQALIGVILACLVIYGLAAYAGSD